MTYHHLAPADRYLTRALHNAWQVTAELPAYRIGTATPAIASGAAMLSSTTG